MFRALICPSSGVWDYVVELPHWLYCSWIAVCWSQGAVRLGWYPDCRQPGYHPSRSTASACNTDTTQTRPHQISNTQRTENTTIDVVIQQQSRKLLMMDILMSETCWTHKKWNKIASDIKLVFYSSNVTMLHGPISIKLLDHFECLDDDRWSVLNTAGKYRSV